MAIETTPSEGIDFNFGILDTSDTHLGNQDLLKDLLSPETQTADPTKITDINAAPEPADPPKPTETKKDDSAFVNTLDAFLNSDDDDSNTAPGTAPVQKQPTVPVIKNPDESAPNTTDVLPTQYEALSNDLFDLGVFQKTDENETPITTPEAFLERFNEEKKRGAMEMIDNFIGQFGPDYQDAFESIFVKGLNPKEYYKTTEVISNFSELDLTLENNQEKVVRRSLSEQGMDTEDIDSEIERLKNYGDLESVAQRHHKVLVKKEAASLQKKTEDAELQHRHKSQIRQEYLKNVNTILQEKLKVKEFDGIPLNPKIANELQDFLLVDKWKTESGETLTDFDRYILDLKRPENHATKVKVGLLLKLLEKDPTLSTIQKTGVTKQTNTLFKEVARQVANTAKNEPSSGTPSSWFTK